MVDDTIGGQDTEHGVTCISWNESPFEPPKLAVGSYSKKASVWTSDATAGGNGKWREECVLGEHNGVVHDIAWAPVMGRSYHLIATASRENCFRVRTVLFIFVLCVDIDVYLVLLSVGLDCFSLSRS